MEKLVLSETVFEFAKATMKITKCWKPYKLCPKKKKKTKSEIIRVDVMLLRNVYSSPPGRSISFYVYVWLNVDCQTME